MLVLLSQFLVVAIVGKWMSNTLTEFLRITQMNCDQRLNLFPPFHCVFGTVNLKTFVFRLLFSVAFFIVNWLSRDYTNRNYTRNSFEDFDFSCQSEPTQFKALQNVFLPLQCRHFVVFQSQNCSPFYRSLKLLHISDEGFEHLDVSAVPRKLTKEIKAWRKASV